MGDEMRNGVAAGFAGPAGEYDALAGHGTLASETVAFITPVAGGRRYRTRRSV